MRTKFMIILSMLVIASMLLVACGGGEAPAPTAAPAAAATTEAATEAATTEAATEAATTEAATEAATTEAAAAATTEAAAAAPAAGGPALTIWTDQLRAPVLETIGKEFTAKTGVNVTVVQKGFGDLRNDFKVAAPTGGGPDILLGAHDWIGELNASGLLAPVELGPNAANFATNAVQAFTYTDGKIYGMPQATENIAFVYNTDLVKEAPKTFEEVKALSKEIKDAGTKYGFLHQTSGDPYHFYPIQTAFGGYIFGQNADGSYNATDLGLNSEGSVAALTWLNSMYEDGLMDRNGNIDGDLMLSAMQNGDAAMVITGPWALNGLREAKVPYAVADIPTGTQPGAPFLGVQGFMVNAFSKNQLLAQTFLQQFVASDATMQAFFDSDPRPSAWIPVSEKITDPDLKAFIQAGQVAQPMPNIPEMNSVWKGQGDAITLVSTGKLSPQEAADQAQAQVETAIKGQ
ncbi:MAG: maltose ABC transporter substrate-binding protein [Anaerolineales bacterium]|nr:maltose ABC transporter substrate-binding protein [Anaerolineales bacterium]